MRFESDGTDEFSSMSSIVMSILNNPTTPDVTSFGRIGRIWVLNTVEAGTRSLGHKALIAFLPKKVFKNPWQGQKAEARCIDHDAR